MNPAPFFNIPETLNLDEYKNELPFYSSGIQERNNDEPIIIDYGAYSTKAVLIRLR